jgi:hypothetical protein
MKTRSRRLTRLALVTAVSAVALVASGCGQEAVVTHAKTEGIWLDAGPLDYHIQASRVLNPGIVPDKSYLMGLPDGTLEPKADEVWFAVFLRIENRTDRAVETARDFEIVDTNGTSFKPYALNADSNPFAYQPVTLQPDEVIPTPDSAQDTDSVQGAELLFKIPLDAYANRPLEFKIHSANGEAPAEASLDLDV